MLIPRNATDCSQTQTPKLPLPLGLLNLPSGVKEKHVKVPCGNGHQTGFERTMEGTELNSQDTKVKLYTWQTALKGLCKHCSTALGPA